MADPATQRSGFGFELSFRLKRGKDDASPPNWPGRVMNGLARCVSRLAPLSSQPANHPNGVLHRDRYLHKANTTFTGSDTISDGLRAFLPDTPHIVLTLETKVAPLHSPTGVVEFYQVWLAASPPRHRACLPAHARATHACMDGRPQIVAFSEDEIQAALMWSSQGVASACACA